jgi:polyribonucleotide nucleotidyltransferase
MKLDLYIVKLELSLHCMGLQFFLRGNTQVMCIMTLGAPLEAQRLDALVGPPTKRFMVHYSFPPF